jgi:hypothetical protein
LGYALIYALDSSTHTHTLYKTESTKINEPS